ncbi:MAG: phenylalanine--tRNA ligase subunit alpha [Candidatus Eremiobacterota bacterium]
MHSVSEVDYRVLTALAGRSDRVSIADLTGQLGLDQSQVTAACLLRAERGEVEVEEQVHLDFKLGKKGRALPGGELPERLILRALAGAGGAAELPALADLTGLEKNEVGQSLRWLKQKGWAEQDGKTLRLRNGVKEEAGPDEQLVKALVDLDSASESDLAARGIDVKAALKLLEGRTGVVEEKPRKQRLVRLTPQGRKLVAEGLEVKRQVTQLTPDMLRTGDWRQVEFRPYDVRLESARVTPGKEHPLVRIFQQTRRVFLEMGFSETVSPYVESGFWDFDALFQPQDHPARDMQDTFYVARPSACQLPEDELVRRVRRTHEDGGDTGSVGWRYVWNAELARKPVLRTHTTASTIRALAADPASPRKVFCVGPVFRRETVDYKHLPVFHQVDGIIIDEQATFANLLGTLQAFYQKMGFKKFQFRPAFFPYTEPSVEIFVWSERKSDWVEMGGAGMFRPEVTRPLGCSAPVLAWGLGLERLAMFRYEVGAISELYRARLTWLKEEPLCR